VILFALLMSLTARADCPSVASAQSLSDAIIAAEQSYGSMDIAAFNANVRLVRQNLRCIKVPVRAVDAAGVHRVIGLEAYVAQRQNDVISSFRAALAASPQTKLPEEIAPKGHLLREMFDRARRIPPQPQQPTRIPPGALMMVDGQASTSRPIDRPAVIQLMQDSPQVGLAMLWSGVIVSGNQPPAWSNVGYAAPPPAGSVPPSSTPRRNTSTSTAVQRRGPRTPMLVAAGVSALAAGSLYAIALHGKSKYTDAANASINSDKDLDRLRQQTNTLAYTSMGLGLTAAGLGAAAYLQVRW